MSVVDAIPAIRVRSAVVEDSSEATETTPLIRDTPTSYTRSREPSSAESSLDTRPTRPPNTPASNDPDGDAGQPKPSTTNSRGNGAHASPPQPSSSSFSFGNVSMTLENSGSVARDHLASERTFLAYLRTSLAIASSGVALVQLFTMASAPSPSRDFDSAPPRLIHPFVRPIGALTVIFGLAVLVIGVVRYFSIQTALTKGQFPVARLSAGGISLALTVLITLTFAILAAGVLGPD
ncbi:hypothetical protein BDN72DRAFT_839069 [Pluteus cervinus]|uniref:Uncharacterized protein n=1 Tax=Pluteus cervinus TaxID=181527 RepID=A0ACD3AXB6_9AGAR|nr:hypothetical protein BDN72DRAFT_839069 [Pluteus cervinus]